MNTIIPKKINNYFELIRLNKPIGFMLLLWPCWFGLAFSDLPNLSILKYYFLFLIGSFTMRSAGCIINDLIDKDIDLNIARTSKRPLASKKISSFNAIIFLILLLLISLIVLFQFKYETIIVTLLCCPLIIIYPFMKRITFWPQLFLGIVFNWGVIICSIEFHNTLKLDYLLLYVSCILWTVGYDTIYAYQDIIDDKKNNIKSTAVLFDDKGKILVFTSYSLMFALIFLLSFWKTQNLVIYLMLILILLYILYNLISWDLKSKESSSKKFRQNNIIGVMIFLYLLSF